MSVKNLKKSLQEIKRDLSHESSLLKLQELLTCPEQSSTIFKTKVLRDMVGEISLQLRKSLLPNSVYHLIQRTCSLSNSSLLSGGRVRSVHDLRGNFLYCEAEAQSLFSKSAQELQNCSIFDLMDKSSKQAIYAKYGAFVLDRNTPRVISYLLQDRQTVLSSRCTLVVFSRTYANYEVGVILETRYAKHSLTRKPPQTAISDIFPFSPFRDIMSPDLILPFKRTPGLLEEQMNWACTRSIESVQITPFLNSSPPKRDKEVEQDFPDFSI